MRLRDFGIAIGVLPTGPLNAITDVRGVRVGHRTLIEGEGALSVGHGPVRTGVTVIVPHGDSLWTTAVYAGSHRLNGNGEMTGLEWIREGGLLAGPIAITNTHSVGVVRDAITAAAVRHHGTGDVFWALPVVAETWDGWLNDIDGQHVRAEHLFEALESASGGPVPEGNVGGGTGMICHEFKGGIGTASRQVAQKDGGYTVGVLVQANHGARQRLAIDGVPIGREVPTTAVPSAWDDQPSAAGSGSIIVIVATDAPLLPHQCQRLAQRAALGVARSGGGGENSSGDLVLAFATGNGPVTTTESDPRDTPITRTVNTMDDAHISPLFWATIEATEEAIANVLVAASDMTGRDGHTARALPHDLLLAAWARHRPAQREQPPGLDGQA